MAQRHSFISAQEGAKLQRLQAEYVVAAKRAAAALRTNGEPLKSESQRFLEEEDKVAVIARRIKEILGTIAEPWHT